MAHESDRNPAAEHEATLAALPWLVNGTLAGEEAARVRAAVGTNLEARRQQRELEVLAGIVRAAPLLDAHAELGFERLRAALDGGAIAADRNWARPTRARPIPPPRPAHRGLALAAGVLLALIAVESAREPSFAPEYRTLTTRPADGATLRVAFDPSLDAAAIDARLARHGARRVGAIDAGNVVRVEPGERGAAALAEALARDPAVRLVAGTAR